MIKTDTQRQTDNYKDNASITRFLSLHTGNSIEIYHVSPQFSHINDNPPYKLELPLYK